MDKYVLITGGTKGIGKAVALCLAASGYDLILTYSSDTHTAEETRRELLQNNDVDVRILKADITNIKSISAIDAYLEEQSLELFSVVFNAGLTCRESFEQVSYAAWEEVFFANVHFPVFLMQRIITKMAKGGSVVFTGSLMGIEPHSVSLAYGVSKSAVHALVKNMVKKSALLLSVIFPKSYAAGRMLLLLVRSVCSKLSANRALVPVCAGLRQ